MKKRKTKFPLFLSMLIVLVSFTSCDQKITEKGSESELTDLSTLEKEIELRLREYEKHLQYGDSIALGNMYTEDAEIIHPPLEGKILSRFLEV